VADPCQMRKTVIQTRPPPIAPLTSDLVPPVRRSRYNRGMDFVVKLTSRDLGVCWLSAANEAGLRSLATREQAGISQSYEDANLAIRKLPQAFKGTGRIYSVESAH
jgi:hypothetical protein